MEATIGDGYRERKEMIKSKFNKERPVENISEDVDRLFSNGDIGTDVIELIGYCSVGLNGKDGTFDEVKHAQLILRRFQKQYPLIEKDIKYLSNRLATEVLCVETFHEFVRSYELTEKYAEFMKKKIGDM